MMLTEWLQCFIMEKMLEDSSFFKLALSVLQILYLKLFHSYRKTWLKIWQNKRILWSQRHIIRLYDRRELIYTFSNHSADLSISQCWWILLMFSWRNQVAVHHTLILRRNNIFRRKFMYSRSYGTYINLELWMRKLFLAQKCYISHPLYPVIKITITDLFCAVFTFYRRM